MTKELCLVLEDVCSIDFIREFRKKRNDNLRTCVEMCGDLGCCLSGEGFRNGGVDMGEPNQEGVN